MADAPMGRRSLLVVLAIAGALVALGGIAAVGARLFSPAAEKIQEAPPLPPAGPAVRALFGDLGDGAAIEKWRLVRVHDLRDGAIPVVLAGGDGREIRVEIRRRDGAGPKAIAETPRLALYLANGGSGSTPTVEESGQAVMALGRALASRETNAPLPPSLTSFATAPKQ
jgi:hypothetical protein